MNSQEFYLWLNGYLENIRKKMKEVKTRGQERVIFGPNVKQPQQQGYATNPPK